MATMTITSPAFAPNGTIPSKYTCDGDNVNPPLHIDEIPPGTKSLALIVDDPDAPKGTWTHWIVWNINPRTPEIAENTVPRESYAGKNTWHRNSYGGPCPPSGTHRYFFKLFALDTVLPLAGNATREQLEEAMEGHVLARAELVGTYGRA
jgi:Raf kinase inhibitor-like YbhB/YbcL family protein